MKKLSALLIALALVIPVTSDTYAKKRTAPGFALFNLNEKLIRSSALLKKGHLILDFWASYCKPCIREMPHLVEIDKKYKKVHLVLVNIDKEGKEKALPVLNKLGVKNECLLDMYQMTAKKFVPKLKVPALFLIDKKGKIVFKAIGDKKGTLERLEKAIRKLK